MQVQESFSLFTLPRFQWVDEKAFSGYGIVSSYWHDSSAPPRNLFFWFVHTKAQSFAAAAVMRLSAHKSHSHCFCQSKISPYRVLQSHLYGHSLNPVLRREWFNKFSFPKIFRKHNYTPAMQPDLSRTLHIICETGTQLHRAFHSQMLSLSTSFNTVAL